MKKSKKGFLEQFPQISRFITALRELGVRKDRLSLCLVLAGLFFFIILNLLVVFYQPPYLQKLLQNPHDKEALSVVLHQNRNPELDTYLKDLLQTAGGLEQVKAIESEKLAASEKLRQVNALVAQNPEFPDGHAYQAVLLYRQRDCGGAKTAIRQAIRLDAERQEFFKLQKVINLCQ